MRINFNREKLTRVLEMITLLMHDYPAGDQAELLVDALINKIRIKMRNRLDTMNVKNSYAVSMPQEEAMAFFLWFSQMEVVMPATAYIFERTIAQEICNLIDRQYGTINRTDQSRKAIAT